MLITTLNKLILCPSYSLIFLPLSEQKMEIISCHAILSCNVVNFRGLKESDPHRPKLPIVRDKRFCSFLIDSRSKRLGQHGYPATVCSYSNEDVASSVLNKTDKSFVLDGEGLGSLTASPQTIPKVSIPSLPDGDNVACITSCFWEWKPNLNVHYETSGSENVDSPAVLFLPGFGVGSFHYEKQLKDLGRDYRAWALDFLGQGKSLPNKDPTLQSKDGNKYILAGENGTWGFGDESETWAKELVYSVDLWKDQVQYFIEEVP